MDEREFSILGTDRTRGATLVGHEPILRPRDVEEPPSLLGVSLDLGLHSAAKLRTQATVAAADTRGGPNGSPLFRKAPFQALVKTARWAMVPKTIE